MDEKKGIGNPEPGNIFIYCCEEYVAKSHKTIFEP
jgi:hypothetical protein